MILVEFLYALLPLQDNKNPGFDIDQISTGVNLLDRCQFDVNARVSANWARSKRGWSVQIEQFDLITVVVPTIIIRYIYCIPVTQSGIGHSIILENPGPQFNIETTSYQYRKSHCGDKTILRPSYLHNGISYTGKMTSLYWIRAQVLTYILSNSPSYNIHVEISLWSFMPMINAATRHISLTC